jgi:polyhydroxybutyrate depolymerase
MSVLIVLAMSLLTADRLPAGDHTRTLEVDGQARSYLVHLPEIAQDAGSLPLVLAFHGGGTNAAVMAEFSGLSEKADEAGFVVAYPNGSGRVERALTFNAGNCCGYAQRQIVDDVKFVRMLLDDVATVLPIDSKRIFATGMSNGAMISYRIACELADRIAAIAPVAGPMGIDECRPSRALSVCHFHGTSDQYAPYAGGVGSRSLTRTQFFSVDRSIEAWVKANGCQAEPQEQEIPAAEGDLKVTRRAWTGGRDGAEVVLYKIHGGGHTWPGRESRFRLLGHSTRTISANDLMWEFFQKHPKR